MAEYLHFDRITISDFSENNIEQLYHEGYVFTRRARGVMDQTRSLRIDLQKFELSSENKRILKKVQDLNVQKSSIPYSSYSWQLGKMAKDFYDSKFGKGTFSANKIKKILTETEKTNFNLLLEYTGTKNLDHCIVFGSNPPAHLDDPNFKPKISLADGYAICFETKNILHYSYPFYDLTTAIQNMGMGMMLLAIQQAKNEGKKYVYLGSAQRPTDIYKLQFKGLEWFDGSDWNADAKELKKILT